VRVTYWLVSSHFLWPVLSHNVSTWACQWAKVHHHVFFAPGLCHSDVALPICSCSHGHCGPTSSVPWLFVPVHHSRQEFLLTGSVPFTSITTNSCDQALFSSWVSCFGFPACLTSDRSTQFTSTAWAAFSCLLHIQHTMTMAYHLQSNVLVERFHHWLKAAL
jgi:hypothetical protein